MDSSNKRFFLSLLFMMVFIVSYGLIEEYINRPIPIQEIEIYEDASIMFWAKMDNDVIFKKKGSGRFWVDAVLVEGSVKVDEGWHHIATDGYTQEQVDAHYAFPKNEKIGD